MNCIKMNVSVRCYYAGKCIKMQQIVQELVLEAALFCSDACVSAWVVVPTLKRWNFVQLSLALCESECVCVSGV